MRSWKGEWVNRWMFGWYLVFNIYIKEKIVYSHVGMYFKMNVNGKKQAFKQK